MQILMPDNQKIIIFYFLLILFLLSTLNGNAWKREVPVTPVKTGLSLPDIPSPLTFCSSLLFNIDTKKRIEPILDFIRNIEFSEMPEEYDLWTDAKVNPYQVNLVDMEDTLLLDLRGFTPPVQKYVTSDFGFRKWRFHYGIDLKVHKGDSVRNAFDGVVRITRRARDYGNFVVVRHFNGLETLYAHLAKITVSQGDTLSSGAHLGLGGTTGRSTGYHLHFETRYLGNPINPNDLIDFESYTIRNQVLPLNSAHFEYKKEIEKIRFWTIKKGDTLSRIAARTGVSVRKLCSLNGIKATTILRIGRRIRYT
ncbi:MAG: peptidoglycan DD-metalloendopeptidase family protein [Bacteroidales bacterium]|nr:peptidoglycan DD-metalloendopeptidase family protein [Bacteroidales bacterium]MDD3989068.1 peptidoglycan DD-metalloendopeptidase family protein [Bacteroidales bacterium]MDD4638763.1 peptidoglycan DD-metalloendopeptidase family protein [Bacteroidales bacterium]